MTIFLENPFASVIATGILLALAFFFWTQTRFKWILYLMAAFFLLGCAMIGIEQYVTTDREAIRETMLEVAEVVGQNDVEGTLSFFVQDEQTQVVRDRARSTMALGKISSCRVRKFLNYEFDDSGSRQKCELRLIAIGSASARGHTEHSQPTEITLDLEEVSPGEWKIRDYAAKIPYIKQPGY